MPLTLEWLRGVEQALGRKPMVYTRRGFVKRCFGSAGALSNYPLWIAHYTEASKPAVPVGWTDWTIWQYSSDGQVKGINSKVDLDRFNGSREELMTFVGRPLVRINLMDGATKKRFKSNEKQGSRLTGQIR